MNAEYYLTQFVTSLERNTDLLSSDEAVDHASKSVFGLNTTSFDLRVMDQKFAQMTPGLKRMSESIGSDLAPALTL